MNITSAKYIAGLDNKNTTVKATIDGQEMFVPLDAEGNRQWVAIQEWVAKGNTIAEAD
jgi:hypothetical protein